MSLLNTPHKQKSAGITTGILLLLLLFMWGFGMKYLDPPIEKGIEITFNSENNKNNTSSSKKDSSTENTAFPKNTSEPVQTHSEEQTPVVTQQIEESVVISPKIPPQKKIEEKKIQNLNQKPSTETVDALANILNASKKTDTNQSKNSENNSIEGNGQNPYSNSFYNGMGNSKGWGLNGRNLIGGQKILPECNETGRVVVQIEVDKSGKVVKITPGVKGTNNNAPCLIDAARKTAQTYRWNADDKAPERQIGFIIINFLLN